MGWGSQKPQFFQIHWADLRNKDVNRYNSYKTSNSKQKINGFWIREKLFLQDLISQTKIHSITLLK